MVVGDCQDVFWCHGSRSLLGDIRTPSPARCAFTSAIDATVPHASRHVPSAGIVPGFPSAPMNFNLGATNRTKSAYGTYSCHQGADVRSGTSMTPLAWRKNLLSHGTKLPRLPNGGLSQTSPVPQSLVRLFCVMNRRAGIHGVIAAPGLAASTSNSQSSASNTCGGVYHSSVLPTPCPYMLVKVHSPGCSSHSSP